MNARHATVALLLTALLANAAVAAGPGDKERALEKSGLVDVSPRKAGQTTVAILPFATDAAEPLMEQFGAGTMDSLINAFKAVPQFAMVDRGRMEYLLKEQAFGQTGLVTPASAPRVGKILGAQRVIVGRVRGTYDLIRISAQLIDVASGKVLVDTEAAGRTDQIFELQDQVAGKILAQQQVALTTGQRQRVERVLRSTRSLTAYEYYLKGRKAYLLFTAKGYQESVRLYRDALAQDTAYALGHAGLAETWVRWGWQKQQNGEPSRREYEEALASATRALALNPELPEAHRALGLAAYYLGKAGADGSLQAATALDPTNAECWYAWWKVSTDGSDPDHEYLRKALALNPGLVPAHLDRGNALATRGQFDLALAEYREALRISPGYAYAHNNIGLALFHLRRYNDAMAAFQEALRLNPGFAMAHNNLGLVLFQLGRPQQAIAAYRRALAINPLEFKAHNNLGTALADMGSHEQAVMHYRKAIDLNSKYAFAYNNLGLTLYYLNRHDEALAAFQSALQLDPTLPYVHNNLGLLLEDLGRHGWAVAEYQEALHLAPNDADTYFNLAQALSRDGRYEAAIEALKKFLQLKPNSAEAQQQLGHIFATLGRWDDTVTAYREVARLLPGSADAHFSLALIYRQMGLSKEAIQAAQHALRLDPNHKAASKWLAEYLSRLPEANR